MLSLTQILSEIRFNTYRAMVRVSYKEDENVQTVAELIRATSGVTTVTTAGHDLRNSTATFSIKLVSKKSGPEAFKALKHRVLTKVPIVHRFEVGLKTLTKV